MVAADPDKFKIDMKMDERQMHERSPLAMTPVTAVFIVMILLVPVSLSTILKDPAHDGACVLFSSCVPVLDKEYDTCQSTKSAPPSPSTASWDSYHSYNKSNSMTQWLLNMSAAHSDICKVTSIGKTWQGRDIWAVKISDNVNADEDEPETLFDGSHHAREWLTTEFCLFIVDTLVTQYATNASIKELVDEREIWVIPMLNPDGRVYDAIDDGNDPTNHAPGGWRKNCRDNNGNGIFEPHKDGVDLNRNYGYKWGTGGSSSNPASETYRGPHAFSEPETIAFRDFVLSRNISTHISYHAYSQLFLYPWDYTYEPPYDVDLYDEICKQMVSSTGNSAGSHYPYEYGQCSHVLYQCSGTTTDWMYGELGIISITEELYPNYDDMNIWHDPNVSAPYDMFHPKPSQILPVCLDNIQSALYMIKIAGNPYENVFDYYFKAEADRTYARLLQGETINYTITMRNLGSRDDSYRLNYSIESGWSVHLPSNVSIPAGEVFEFRVNVTAPATAVNGSASHLAIRISSKGDPTINKTIILMSRIGNFSVSITAPSVGSHLIAGVPYVVQWTTTNGTLPYSTDIDYSITNESGPYITIATGLAGNGSRVFTPPTGTTEAWIRVTATDSSSPPEQTECIRHVFIDTVPKPTVSIISPTNFEVWRGGGTYQIEWAADGGVPPLKVRLDYSMSFPFSTSGAIAYGLHASGTHSWKLPMELIGGIVQITATVQDSALRNSTAAVSVVVLPPFYVTITPSTAFLMEGETQVFTAQAYELTLGGESKPIESGIMFMWNVTSSDGITRGSVNPSMMSNTTTFTALSRGECTVNCIGFKMDTMSVGLPGTASVTVYIPEPPYVELVSPRGGEKVAAGGSIDIRWNITSFDDIGAPYTINIAYSDDGGFSFGSEIAALEQDSSGEGQYLWKLPAGMTEPFMVGITVTDRFGQSVFDFNRENITISVPKNIRVFYGHNTGAEIMTELPLVSIVTDKDEYPVTGAAVVWNISSAPEGAERHEITEKVTYTDREGKARTHIRLGTVAGEYITAASSPSIPNSNAVFRTEAFPGEPAVMLITPLQATMHIGETEQFCIEVYDEYGNRAAYADSDVVWIVEGGIGTVSSEGYFTATSSGKGCVKAICKNNVSATANVTVSGNPVVVETQPHNGETNVPVDTFIIVTFSERMNRKSVSESIKITPRAAVEHFWFGNTLLMKLSDTEKRFEPATRYIVTISGNCVDAENEPLDGNGNAVWDGAPADDYVWDFTTGVELNKPPVVVFKSPMGISVPISTGSVHVTFSKEMNRTSVERAFSLVAVRLNPKSAGAGLLANTSGSIGGEFVWSDDGKSFEYVLSVTLTPGTQYRAVIDGSVAKDRDGLMLDGNSDSVGKGDSSDSCVWEFVTQKDTAKSNELQGFGITSSDFLMFIVIISFIAFLMMLAYGRPEDIKSAENTGKPPEKDSANGKNDSNGVKK